ncbi:MAG: hypothetical protein LBT59_05655, partial [Clostridiales bacterium]|nr:hypothetical protein [Clostridiales bacterium]
MMNKDSVRLLIDAVYETHWDHFKEHFGKTIAGFFSDEPELGNGHLYDVNNQLGTDIDLPFSKDLEAELEKSLGDWKSKIHLLWDNSAPEGSDSEKETAKVRLAYMNAVTTLVRDCFSYQVGDWCRSHGVSYIGHSIEDNGEHARTGSGLGHYFRGLEGQDFAGIDDIGGQVYPQGEEDFTPDFKGEPRNATFYHFMLGRLGSSAANIERQKNGRALCEIFGNYGWTEGVQLEKYLLDHFISRGINYFVPHAFSPKAFPDPDCPPHFYAHGHNPQYRHFGALMQYTNRVCTLLSSGVRVSDVALLYHAEGEWTGDYIPNEQTARILEENQISFDIVPFDYFNPDKKYVPRNYKALVVPCERLIPETGLPVIKASDNVLEKLEELGLPKIKTNHQSPYLSVLQVEPSSFYFSSVRDVNETFNLSDICYYPVAYFFSNQGKDAYSGVVTVPSRGPCFSYNAWDNRLEAIEHQENNGSTDLKVFLEPSKSLIIIFGDPQGLPVWS